MRLGALSLEQPGPCCSSSDSEPGLLARMVSQVGLALALLLSPPPQLAPWQPGLSVLISSRVDSGWVRASCPPLENKKTCFASGGVEWGGLSGSRPGPQQGRQWAGSLLLLEWRAGSPAPVSSSCPSTAGWRAGEEAPGLQAPAEPPVTTREQWPGGAGGCAPEQPRLFQAPTSDRDRLLQGLLPLPRLVFHLAGHTISHHGAKENSGLRKWLWAVAGVLQLWEVAEWEEGTTAGRVLHRLHSAWDCS